MLSHTTILVAIEPGWLEISNEIATWFTAIGTVGAVAISLWLIYTQQSERINVHTGTTTTIIVPAEGESSSPPPKDELTLTIVNKGLREVTLESIKLSLKGGQWAKGVQRAGKKIAIVEKLYYKVPISDLRNVRSTSRGLNARHPPIWTVRSTTGKVWVAKISKYQWEKTLSDIEKAIEQEMDTRRQT